MKGLPQQNAACAANRLQERIQILGGVERVGKFFDLLSLNTSATMQTEAIKWHMDGLSRV